MSRKEIVRCNWCKGSELMMNYHDEEWGTPLHDDRKHFEFIILDGFQAGLSWSTIINKRDNFRKAFDNFEAKKIAKYDEEKIAELLENPGIVRNKLKVHSAVTNAKAFLAVQKEFGTFDKYIWKFTGGKTLKNARTGMGDIPAKTNESDTMSKDLLKRGFKFVGSTICYAYMQAAGMVNDHIVTCHRYKTVSRK